MKSFNCVKIELLVLGSNTSNHLTVCKQMSSGLFKDFTNKLYIYIYINRIWHWITHKGCYAIKHNQTKPNIFALVHLFAPKSRRANSVNHTTGCKLFLSDQDTWYHITVQKKKKTLKNQLYKKMNTIPSPQSIKQTLTSWHAIKSNQLFNLFFCILYSITSHLGHFQIKEIKLV